MTNSVRDFPTDVAFWRADDWQNFLDENTFERAFSYHDSSNPLAFSVPLNGVGAVWIVCKKRKIPLFIGYFFDRLPLTIPHIGKESKHTLRQFVGCLTTYCHEKSNSSTLKVDGALSNKRKVGNLSKHKHKEFFELASFYEGWLEQHCVFVKDEDLLEHANVFYLKIRDFGEEKEHLNFFKFIYDFIFLKSKSTSYIPWKNIYSSALDNPFLFEKLYFEPTEFWLPNPDKAKFQWPWQRCLYVDRQQPKSLKFDSIDTTSLVADLRWSTAAMEQFTPPEKYGEFLDRIVSECREIILEQGGYFDKETGDGFVSHFCYHDIDNVEDKTIQGTIDALVVSKKLVDATAKIIESYKPFFTLEIESLGLGIGIHSEKAVWLFDDHQIRALGPSVVKASRFQSNARQNEVIISANSYSKLIARPLTQLPENLIDGFTRKKLKIKELAYRAGFYGYSKKLR